ncbi:MAG TPA: carboxypeptidase regulatory-like domain-containing protein, partial [Polyangiaceae bacterium LLY-WYZ-15_(1-7)]|nr:carboxypeptidase regulatory-like domain-containing protein [Polyangiaceae bacterium LLY-WYZ-15_(1-7)]
MSRWTIVGGAALLAAGVMGAWQGQAQPTTATATALTAVEGAACDVDDAPARATRRRPRGDAETRRAAQRALGFLSESVSTWQREHRCYGCHVQAVSLEGLSVGRAHGYDVSRGTFGTVLEGLLDLPGGARTDAGLSYHGSQLVHPSNAFGGAALASYDALVDERLSDDLLRVASRLEELQENDGSIGGNYVNPPVAVGTIQSTTQAVQTWRQAYARSADDRWLRPIRRAEDWLSGRAEALAESADVQQIDYAVLGLLAAGARSEEARLQRLARRLRTLQRPDGSFGSPLLTGQALYVLRRLGASEGDRAVRRGTRWLVGAQQGNGGWGAGGAARGTATWGVLGLVSLDVTSIDLRGLRDGQHLGAPTRLEARARDNEGSAIARTEIFVDDVRVASRCGDRVALRLDPAALEPGRHIVRAVATNARGRSGTTLVELYAGDHFLTEPGSRWEGGGTVIGVRDVAPESLRHRVELQVLPEEGEGRPLATVTETGRQGALELRVAETAEGEPLPRGRYRAKLIFRDARGVARQELELPFVHDTPDAQHARYGQVAGQLRLDAGVAQNAEVELVDGEGNVVQRTTTTRSGRYRFRNVDRGRYLVRVRRRGM